MFGRKFELNAQNLSIIEEIGKHMPGGFFIYKAAPPEELLYANHAVYEIFGCANSAEFEALTGNTFKGMLHPDDYEAVSQSIVAMTANAFAEDVQAAMDAGMQAHIAKPVDIAVLHKTLQEVLATSD